MCWSGLLHAALDGFRTFSALRIHLANCDCVAPSRRNLRDMVIQQSHDGAVREHIPCLEAIIQSANACHETSSQLSH